MNFGLNTLTFLAALAILLSSVRAYPECPSVCTCKWKHGKQTAECTGKGLTVIPSEVNAGTQVMDLSRNSFTELPSRSFQKKGLVNLQKIFLSDCGMTKVAADAFYQLRNLVELDLSGNKLQAVPAGALLACPSLRRLQLSNNPIRQVESGAFATLKQATNLGLANCEIRHLNPGALEGLESLESIELDGNRLTTLPIDVLKPLISLNELNLHNNPWHCDCKIRDIRTWMKERKIPLSIPPHCTSPTVVKDQSWSTMTLDDFACAPIMIPVPTEATVVIDQNVSIMCRVDASPEAIIHWEIGGRSLKNISISPELRAKYSVEFDDLYKQASILTIYNAAESDSDSYVCVAENKAGISYRNFTLTVVYPDHLNGTWNSFSITMVLVGVLLLILLAAAAICTLVHYPISLPFGSKLSRSNVLQHLSSKKQDTVEMNDVGMTEKDDKDLKVTDKQPRHETGSSGYGSDQLTPDLVSKIADMNNGPSLSTSSLSCNHLESDNPVLLDGYGSAIDHWPLGKPKPARYEASPIRSNNYSEIYLNPYYSKDDDPYNYALQAAGVHQLPDCSNDRYVPQNDRVRTLRESYEPVAENSTRDMYPTSPRDETYKRYPLMVANASGQCTLPQKTRFSPDEGYAEEGLEGTEV